MTIAAPVPVAIAMSSFAPGGTERQMIELVRRLDRSRWSVHVACLRREGAWLDRVEGVAPIARFGVTSFKHPSLVSHGRAFARWCRERRIAIVQATDFPTNLFALPAAALAGVPVRLGSRRDVNPGRTVVELALQRGSYAFGRGIVANSHAAADRLRAELVPARKIAVVPNGLDLARFAPKQLDAPPRRVVVVANLRPEKRHAVLIDAAPAVLRAFPDARFEIVGGGSERDRLVARVRSLGVEPAFSFVGHCDDVAARLAAADIFVLPSRSEAFPNAVLEAMAAGLPVVASGVGGILELIDDGRTGLLVPPDAPAALADRLCRLMASTPLAAALGAAARAEVEARYSFDRMVAGFERLYLTELTRRGLAARAPQLATS